MHDDFKVVKGRRKRKQNFRETQHLFILSETSVQGKLKKAKEELRGTRFCFDLLQNINQCLKEIDLDTISEILCYGLGNFSENKAALHQLAALIIISEQFKCSVTIYDPVFNLVEINVLNSLTFNVLSENEEGKRKISKKQANLIFLPHCPKQLVNNLLWANWNVSLCHCILIGNSFTKIIQQNTKKTIEKSANFIFKIHNRTTEIPIEDSYHLNNIFNDLSIHHFKHCELTESFFAESLEGEPTYSEDIEFITASLKISHINDE